MTPNANRLPPLAIRLQNCDLLRDAGFTGISSYLR